MTGLTAVFLIGVMIGLINGLTTGLGAAGCTGVLDDPLLCVTAF